jgi:hypothetical protein
MTIRACLRSMEASHFIIARCCRVECGLRVVVVSQFLDFYTGEWAEEVGDVDEDEGEERLFNGSVSKSMTYRCCHGFVGGEQIELQK